MMRIQLTQGQWAIVDEEDYDRLCAMGRWHSHLNTSTNKFYACHNYKRLGGKQNLLLMHREILGLEGIKPKTTVLHIDGNTLNNTRINLKLRAPKGGKK